MAQVEMPIYIRIMQSSALQDMFVVVNVYISISGSLFLPWEDGRTSRICALGTSKAREQTLYDIKGIVLTCLLYTSPSPRDS